MDPGLGRGLALVAFAAALAGGVGLARSQQTDPGAQTPPTPDQAASPSSGQGVGPVPGTFSGPGSGPGPAPSGPPGPEGPPPPVVQVPPVQPPPAVPTQGQAQAPASAPPLAASLNAAKSTNAINAPAQTAEEAPKPPPPPPPGRGPAAVIQVLDKVSAETLRFEAPIGRRIRYKTLVFTVRVCEVRGAGDPLPRPAAYVDIDSEAAAMPGNTPPPAKSVYHGWMFAAAPGLHPLEHPIYDAWLVACSAAAPVS